MLVNERLIDEMNLQCQVFLAHSVDIFNRAWTGYMECGRGAILVHYDSFEHMKECIERNRFNGKYTEMTEMLTYNYLLANDLMKKYNPRESFVLVVAIKYMQGYIFGGTIVLRNAQFKYREMMERAGISTVPLAPPPPPPVDQVSIPVPSAIWTQMEMIRIMVRWLVCMRAIERLCKTVAFPGFTAHVNAVERRVIIHKFIPVVVCSRGS